MDSRRARAGQHSTLSNALVTGAIATNTNWSIAKNGGLASGTVSWTVGVTKISVSDQIIQVDGQFRITNIGTGPATLGNIVVNLQRPCGVHMGFGRGGCSRRDFRRGGDSTAISSPRHRRKMSHSTSPVRRAPGPAIM